VSSVLLLNQELDCTLWQGAIAEAGAIEALVELASKWPSGGGDGVLVSFSTKACYDISLQPADVAMFIPLH
jgi:hypothetical protein